MKRIIWSVVFLLLGMAMTFGGIMAVTGDKVTCGSVTMHEGDICEQTSKKSGRVTENTYSEQQTDTRIGGSVGIVFGLLFIAVGAQNLRIGIRNRKRGPAPVAQPVPAGPGYPPQQWNQAPMQQPMPPQQWNQPPQQPQWNPQQQQQPQQWNPQQQQQPPQWNPQPPQQPQWNQQQPPPPPGWGG